MIFSLILALVMVVLLTILRLAVRSAFGTGPPQNTVQFGSFD